MSSCSKHFDFSHLSGEACAFVMVELRFAPRKHFDGEENALVELAGGSDPSLKLGLRLRGPIIGLHFLGLKPFSGLWGCGHPHAVSE